MRASVMTVVLMLSLLAATGCGKGQGEVSGQVLFNGKPLPGGRVTFRPADPRANSVSAELDREGNYQAILPTGKVAVSIDNRELAPAPALGGISLNIPLSPEARKALGGGTKAGKPTPAEGEGAPARSSGRYVPIPERYHEAETSGLELTVQRGTQKHNIELKN